MNKYVNPAFRTYIKLGSRNKKKRGVCKFPGWPRVCLAFSGGHLIYKNPPFCLFNSPILVFFQNPPFLLHIPPTVANAMAIYEEYASLPISSDITVLFFLFPSAEQALTILFCSLVTSSPLTTTATVVKRASSLARVLTSL